MSEIADRLKKLRGSKSQKDFSSIFGLKQTTYGKYERGITSPDLETASLICRKLGLNPRWLMLGEGEMYEQAERVDIKEEVGRQKEPVDLAEIQNDFDNYRQARNVKKNKFTVKNSYINATQAIDDQLAYLKAHEELINRLDTIDKSSLEREIQKKYIQIMNLENDLHMEKMYNHIIMNELSVVYDRANKAIEKSSLLIDASDYFRIAYISIFKSAINSENESEIDEAARPYRMFSKEALPDKDLERLCSIAKEIFNGDSEPE